MSDRFRHDDDEEANPVVTNAAGQIINPPVSGTADAGIPDREVLHGEQATGKLVDASQGVGGGATFTQGGDEIIAAGGRVIEVPGGGPDLTRTEQVGDATDPATQGTTPAAEAVKTDIVPGAVTGPDAAGIVRNAQGYVADAPAGSMDAAFSGRQVSDTTGAVTSTGTDNETHNPGLSPDPARGAQPSEAAAAAAEDRAAEKNEASEAADEHKSE